MVPTFSAYGYGVFNGADLIPELSGVNLIRDMAIMADTDETVGAMMYCISTVLRQVNWTHVGQSNGIDAPDDSEAKRWADMAQSMLIDMDRPVGDHLEDMMTMLWAGFAPCEIVTKQRNSFNSRFTDNYWGIGSLNLIDQSTIWDWEYDSTNTKLVSMRQMGMNLKTGTVAGNIPLFKTLLYRTWPQYNNPRGKPLLKPAWRVWKLKRKVQDSEAIGIDRDLCGLPIFEMPQEMIDQQFEVGSDGKPTEAAQRAMGYVRAAQAAVTDMRYNRSGGLVIPSDDFGEEVEGSKTKKFNFRIQTTGGQRSIDARTAARDYDHAIARIGMMQFLTLGQRSGGSYGLSEDQSSMAVQAIMALAQRVVEEWDNKLIPLIWNVNAFPQQYRPRLSHSQVNKNTIVQIGQFMAGIGKAQALWENDPKMRIAMARMMDIAYDADAQNEAAQNITDTADATLDTLKNPPPVAAPGAPGQPAARPKPKPADNED